LDHDAGALVGTGWLAIHVPIKVRVMEGCLVLTVPD
jgi:hypothetical protein